jgi:hypothetical protein
MGQREDQESTMNILMSPFIFDISKKLSVYYAAGTCLLA